MSTWGRERIRNEPPTGCGGLLRKGQGVFSSSWTCHATSTSPDVVTLSVFGGVTGFPDATRSNERLCISGDWFSCPPVCASALGSHETRSRDRGRDRGQGRLCSCQSVRCGYAAVLFLTVWGGTALGTQKKDGGSVAFSVVRLQIWL